MTELVVSNPSRIRLVGLPVTHALPATGEDLRTVNADGLSVRLLTMPVAHDGAVVGYVQGGFVLDLHDRQSASLVASVAIVALAGLLGAALVTLVVTGRSMIPIRRTFEAQARFVADASHELRTPAALIRANAEVLDREALVSEEGQPLLGDIIGEADRLAALVDDLLAVAAFDATGPRPPTVVAGRRGAGARHDPGSNRAGRPARHQAAGRRAGPGGGTRGPGSVDAGPAGPARQRHRPRTGGLHRDGDGPP